MIVYVLSAVSSIGFSCLAARSVRTSSLHGLDHTRRNLLFAFCALLSFLPLCLVSALRYGIAFDYFYTYVPEYYQIMFGHKVHSEFGFVLLNKLVYLLFDNVDWLFVLTSVIFLVFVFKTIYSRSVNIPLSLFLLLGTRMYYSSFGQIRQYMVIAAFLFATKYIEEKKLLKYAAIIAASACIHTLALAYLPVYFFCRIKMSRKAYLLSAFAALSAYELIKSGYLFFAGYFYGGYITAKYGISNTSSMMIVLTAIVFVLGVVYYKSLAQTVFNTVLLNLQWLAMIVAVTSVGLNESYRVLALFMYSSILLVPQIIKAETKKNRRAMLTVFIVLIFSFAAVYYIFTAGLLPYRTIFMF